MSVMGDDRAVATAPIRHFHAPQPSVADDPHEAYLRTKTFSALNGVRCICCLAVIKEHVKWEVPGPRLLGAGWLGVDLFFVISGFLIVTLLLRERDRRGSVSLRNFYARRSLRIFPIYYLLILAVFSAYLAAAAWHPNGLRYYLPALPILLTYTLDVIPVAAGSFFHCWSLAAEEQFYLLWPAVERFAGRGMRWAVLAALLLLNQAVNFGLFDGLIVRVYGGPGALQLQIYMITFTPILLGVLLAYLLHGRATFGALYRLVGHRWSPFVFLAGLVAVCDLAPHLAEGWARLAIHVLFMLMLASLVVREDHFARPILTLGPIARIGAISYGMYLYHVWIINFLGLAWRHARLGPVPDAVMFLLATALTVAAAEVSFRLIEQPLLGLKGRFHS